MNSRAMAAGTLNQYIYEGKIDLLGTHKVALLSDGYQPAFGWAATTAQAAGDIINPNGRFYRATTAGTTGEVEPTWPVNGGNVVDGTVTWVDVGVVLPKYGCKDSSYSDVSVFEVGGVGYTLGGATVGGLALQTTEQLSKVVGSDVRWNNSTITALYAADYVQGTFNGVINPLVSVHLLDDTYTPVSSNDTDLVLSWGDNGIHQLRHEE